jgi:hypothetical protein
MMAKQRNKDMIQQLSKENKDLREELKAKALTNSGVDTVQQQTYYNKTVKELASWKRRQDEQKNQTLAKKKQLLNLQDK